MMNHELHDLQALQKRIEALEQRLLALEGLVTKHMLTHPKPAVSLPLVGETT